MITREPLTWLHLREATSLGWLGWQRWSDARLKLLPMIGIAMREHDALVALGGIVWLGERPLAIFRLHENFRADRRSRWVHRHAINVIAAAHTVSPVIYATADKSVPNAIEFLERLGFTLGDDGREWSHGVCDPGSASGGLIRRLECGVD